MTDSRPQARVPIVQTPALLDLVSDPEFVDGNQYERCGMLIEFLVPAMRRAGQPEDEIQAVVTAVVDGVCA